MKLYIKPFFIMVSLASVSGGMTALDQAMLERRLACYAQYEDGQYEPVRRRDILSSYTGFIQETGCTTNELIEGLMFAVTNNLTECNWTNETGRAVATAAALHLGEIDNSSITNFFRILNDTDTSDRLKDISIPAMFWHTNLEPEVLSYMRNICVRTNIYDRIAPLVSHYIYETIDLMPDDLKMSVTNRVANYLYFSICHTTRQVVRQDRKLAFFLSAYSNSIQRLDAMRYVQSTTTNLRTRVLAQQEVDRLSAIPTNQLNDISWIAEDL